MPAAYEQAAKASGQKLQLKVINKLSSADPQGAVPGIILIVLLIGGYLGATFAMLRTKTTATHHRVTALGHAVILGLVIDVIAGPILGGYPDVGSRKEGHRPGETTREHRPRRTDRDRCDTRTRSKVA